MKKQEWSEGLNHLDPALVEEYVLQKESLKKKSEKKKKWRPIASVAACLLLIVGVSFVIPKTPSVPAWSNALYTAEAIEGFFPEYFSDGVATNSYTKVYFPDDQFLHLNPLTEQKYLPLYQRNVLSFEEDEEAFREFLDTILPKLFASLEISIPRYEIERRKFFQDGLTITFPELDSPYMSAAQTDRRYSIYLYHTYSENREITLDGEIVQIDQRLSDQEIIASLSSVREKLCNVFGESFPDTKIIRRYYEYDAEGITVYFYDKSAHPLNEFQVNPVSDSISLEFHYDENSEDDIATDGIRKASNIIYSRSRGTMAQKYSMITATERISLEEAEALLYNGYVFGGHSCPLCMAEQEKVDFEGYDFVSMEYLFRYYYNTDREVPSTGIPFYAFYKQIGTAENGNLIYAKTYVPAIPVSGYTEYFEKQKENHGKYTFPETEYEPYPG